MILYTTLLISVVAFTKETLGINKFNLMQRAT